MNKKAGILFDYNGVIVDDEHLQEQAMGDITKRHGVPLNHELYITYCLGRPDKEGLQNLQSAFPRLAETPVETLVTEKVERYRHLIENESILFPGLTETLRRLHKHFALAVVTGSLRSEIDTILVEEGIKSFFTAVISADDISRGKPDPEGYLKGMAALKLPPEQIVAVEDTPRGIEAAQAAGLTCIAVAQTVEKRYLTEADVVLDNVTQMTPQMTPELVWPMIKNSAPL
jgi:HAD superfamily hydrolase (TIGR01509 family)